MNEGIKIWHAENKLHLFVPQNNTLSEDQATFIRLNKSEIIEALKANEVNSKSYDSLILKTQSKQVALSFAQERLWFIQKYKQGTHAYHIPMIYSLKSNFDLNSLEKSIRKVVDRHEALRSLIHENENGDSVQSVLNSSDTLVKIVRKKLLTEKQLQHSIDQEINQIFDLSHEIPIRVAFFECEGIQPILSIVIHHIAFDGWSMEVFFRELESLYLSYSSGAPLTLPEPPLQYKDFALWQRCYLKGKEFDRQLEFWKKKLTGYEALNFPLDNPRSKEINYSGGNLFFKLDIALSRELRKMAQELQVSLYSLLISAYFLVLRAFSNQDDILVGTPIANRHFSALKEIVGFFVNNIVIRAKICSQETIETFIQRMGKEVIEAQLHQDLPFDKIVNEIELSKDTSRHPLFQVMFTVQSFTKKYQKESLLEPYDGHSYYQVSYFDITTFIDDSEEELQVQCNFAENIFKKETIETFVSTYQEVLKQFVKPKAKKTLISEIKYLNESAYRQIIVEWNKTEATYPRDQTLSQLFTNQVKKTPNALALVYDQIQLTYQELDDRSTQLAHYLMTQYQFPKETLIGLCLDRSEFMVIAILGILKAGYAYVPIDPRYPEERIKFILSDTSCPLLLVDTQNSVKIAALHQQLLVMDNKKVCEVLSLQPLNRLDRQNEPTSLAYVMYTSGTSGNPKGVMVEHRGVINLVYFLTKKYSFSEQEGILQNVNYVFDVSIKQIMLALLNGLKLVLMPDYLWANEKAFYEYLKNHNVSHLGGTPSQLEMYDYQQLPSVKRVSVGGEFLSSKFYDKVSKQKTLYNVYGVTEASITSTFHCTSKDNLTIGFPIANVTCYVLNRDLLPVPLGAIGELFIGGDGVARGYLNNSTLTAQKFIHNPFQTEIEKKENKNARLYRTGDLARRWNDGHIQYIGRNDFQVKIRGHRIELKEIEQTIALYDKTLQCIVSVKGDINTSQYLVVYTVSKNTIDQKELKDFLRERLPDYMVPEFIIPIKEIPLSTNGKIDTKLLPSPTLESSTYIPPKTPFENAVVKVWSDVLGIAESKISVEDSFFHLGGNSILAIKLISKINDINSNLSASVAEVFTYRTIREFCCFAERKEIQKITIQKSSVLQEEDQVLSFAQERLWFFDQYAPHTGVYNIPMLFKISENIDLERLEKALKAIIQRHEILRTVIRTSQKGAGYQVVYDMAEHPFTTQYNHFQNTDELLKHYEKESYHLFDLSQDYPIKISINEVMHEYYLCIIAHHIAFDGWSVENFMKELNHFYYNELKALEELPIQYKDYALWQRKHLSGKKFEKLASFWKSKLEGFEPLNFPTDYPRPQEIKYLGANQTCYIDGAISESIRKVAQKFDLSMHILLLGAYCIVLKAFAYQKTFVVGIPFANRHFKEIEPLIGFFVNALPIKILFHQSETLGAFLKRIEQEVTEAQIHQDLPFETIVDMLETPKDLSRHPIFQQMFTVLDSHQGLDDNHNVIQPFDAKFSFNVAKMDLTLTVDLTQPKFHVIANYAVSLFSDETIKSFLESFEKVLTQIAQLTDQGQKQKEIRIQDLHFTNHIEKKDDFKKIEYPVHKTIHELFEEQVIKTPNNIAVKSRLSQLDYLTLNELANQVAHFLIEKCDVKPGDLVSLVLDRNSDLIFYVLGILKAGGAFVPIDPSMPDERIAYMLKDSGASIILTNRAYQDRLVALMGDHKASRLVVINSPELQEQLPLLSKKNPTLSLQSSSLAYVIYTSGTTGFPKGVMIEHTGIVNLKYELSKAYGLNEIGRNEVILQSSNYSFDPFVEQIILSLLNGHILLIMPDQLWLEQEPFYEFLNTHRVTHINAPPSLLKQYDFCRVPSLKRLVFGGEVLTSDCFSENLAKQGTQVINVYGPTETTIITTFNFVQDNDLCIGRPISNVTCYILDENRKILPQGAVGELYIGGIGLGRGYWNSPLLTEEKFVSNPFQSPEEKRLGSNAKLYRTGDLVKQRHDGKIDYQGRIDSQIKIRGYRVELKDIEMAILSIDGVLQSAVVLDNREINGKDKYLLGYFVSATNLDTKQMKDHLRQKLPSYMVPVALIQIDRLPMINGKLNYRQLPLPVLTFTNNYKEPTNEIETQLCKIWADVLKTNQNKISIDQSFFSIGGNSIMSIQLINNINQHFKIKLTISDLFITESIEMLALKMKQKYEEYKPIRTFNNNSFPHLFMIHPGGSGCEVYVPLAKQLETYYSCHGVDSYHLNHDDKMESLRKLAMYYLKYVEAIMEKTRQTHYFLLGWSFGGKIALEMAALLEEKGVKNITVFLLDFVHHDEKISDLKKMFSPEQADKIHWEHLVSEGHNQDSIMRMRQALQKEETLMEQQISSVLCNTRIVLFKAMLSGPNFGERALKEYQKYVLSLPKNNIDLLVKDPSMVDVVQLHQAHHLTILTNGMQEIVEKITVLDPLGASV